MKLSGLNRNVNKQHYRAAGIAVAAAGTLLLAAGAPALERAHEFPEETNPVTVELLEIRAGRLLTISARSADRQHVLDEIGGLIDLKIVQFEALEGTLSLSVTRQPLPVVLKQLLRGHSYQLYQSRSDTSVLWIFSDGIAASSPSNQRSEFELMHGDRRARRETVFELRKLKSNEAVGPLSFALADEHQDIRIRAIYALAEIGSDDAVVALASAGADEDPWVRGEAAAALASIGGDASVHHLNLALRDPDRNVRIAVITALADVPGEQSAEVLARALRDPDPLIRIEAVDALEEIGGASALQVLSQAESSQDADVTYAIEESLAVLGGRE